MLAARCKILKNPKSMISMKEKPKTSLTPTEKKPNRRFGALKGKITIAKDFDAPLPEAILCSFEETSKNK